MNKSNFKESPSANSEDPTWRIVDIFIVALWLVIPICILIGRQKLLPLFLDFGVELPTATRYLLGIPSLTLSALAAITVLLGTLHIHSRRQRIQFSWVAFATGLIASVAILILVLGPLFRLWNDLA